MVFGERLASRQSIQFTIARMQARVHTARLAWHHAARLCGAGRPFTAEAAIAKVFFVCAQVVMACVPAIPQNIEERIPALA